MATTEEDTGLLLTGASTSVVVDYDGDPLKALRVYSCDPERVAIIIYSFGPTNEGRDGKDRRAYSIAHLREPELKGLSDAVKRLAKQKRWKL